MNRFTKIIHQFYRHNFTDINSKLSGYPVIRIVHENQGHNYFTYFNDIEYFF
jgi:hypothetical protein